jgi:WhiB family transcriptional regulator, redox-sensing transcriptional regulator
MADTHRAWDREERRWDWQSRAACRGVDTARFYHPENERGSSRARRERAAKAVCATCTVIEDCLRWALRTREQYGVWGGLSAEEREALLERDAAEPNTPHRSFGRAV